MTPNVSFALLDAAVIAGHGEDPVVDRMTYARLLEDSAALGGVLSHLGVHPAVQVVVDLESDLDAVVAALAVARLGGVLTTEDHPDAPVVVVSSGSPVPGSGRVRVVRGEGVQEPDLDWDLMLRAGRTDPAAVEVLDPDASYGRGRTVAEQIEALKASAAPYSAAALRDLLLV